MAPDTLEAAVAQAATEVLCSLSPPCPEHLRQAREVIGHVVVVLSGTVLDCYRARLAASGSAEVATAETLMLMSQLLLPIAENME